MEFWRFRQCVMYSAAACASCITDVLSIVSMVCSLQPGRCKCYMHAMGWYGILWISQMIDRGRVCSSGISVSV